MTNLERMAALYGEAASYSEYHIGDRITYLSAHKRKGGTVVYVVAATPTQPLIYVVSPDVEKFPEEVLASEILV